MNSPLTYNYSHITAIVYTTGNALSTKLFPFPDQAPANDVTSYECRLAGHLEILTNIVTFHQTFVKLHLHVFFMLVSD